MVRERSRSWVSWPRPITISTHGSGRRSRTSTRWTSRRRLRLCPSASCSCTPRRSTTRPNAHGGRMQVDEVRFLFAYDRWTTRRVLAVLDGLDPGEWSRTDVVDERGLGAILVHHLGASQRWRHAFQETGESPEPEREL